MKIPTPIPTPSDSIPIPISTKKSFFASKKRINRFAIFLMISGVGGMWLTYWWEKVGSSQTSFNSFPVLYYFIFNSSLLFLSGFLLLTKQFKIYSLLAVILGISVTSSLFVFGDTSNVFNNLFFSTTALGMTFGAIYGGIVLVPMFLWGVYRGAFRGFKHLRGRAIYNPQ